MSNTDNRTISDNLEIIELKNFNSTRVNFENRLKLSNRDKSIPLEVNFNDCSTGRSNPKAIYTVFDFENVQTISCYHSYFRGVMNTKMFSPENWYFHSTFFEGIGYDSFTLDSNARFYASGTTFRDIRLRMRGDAFISSSFSVFHNTRFLSNLTPDIIPNKNGIRFYENTFSNVHIESNAFVNADFEKCMFNYIFVHEAEACTIRNKSQFENCTFEKCIFIDLDPFKKNYPIFRKCKFINCHFVDKRDSMFDDCEFSD